ncbi:NAD(P)H-dependent oxidoreductase [Amycolatopsis orientalis]|uniref:NAD(P)H-dependent oxidoreductase n=1 Tax=Amycolatopsis orientalis TaxID=31958 RepID=UPI0003A8745B|nr:NAD(P)H-dependent oxidoreductase [Amycolatopsis orientalis]
MNVLWIYAHPDPASLNGALRDEGVATLRDLGHDVRVSDLYAMRWNPIVDEIATVPEDVRTEHGKLDWADTVVVQFPLWWADTPAILKGWFDRVFVQGYGYDYRDETGHTLRYGNGVLAGKRAMVIVTAGAHEDSLGPRGAHGSLDDLLFNVQHGTLFYTGMTVLPPLKVTGTNRMTPEKFDCVVEQLRKRLHSLETTDPLPLRTQDGGDYDRRLVLHPEVAPGQTGYAAHLTA